MLEALLFSHCAANGIEEPTEGGSIGGKLSEEGDAE
jgi:hypothetical protein